jgi:hypothetical protein
MSILIKTVRVAGFRGLENLEVELEQTTVLTGMNNTGKTSFLKALQIALGNRQFVEKWQFIKTKSGFIAFICLEPIRFTCFKSRPFFKDGLLYFIAVFNGIKCDGGSKW